ncbi:MAG: cytochrome c oxidase subunit II [Chloroflexi bacterium]|nr:cytochrome c oxidase subunit II [Chloroflexota bacterium]
MLSFQRIPAAKILSGLILCTTVFLAGCAGSPSPMAPASPNATTIYNLTVIVFVIAAAVFIVVEGMLFFSVIRFSRKQSPGEPEQIEGNTKFEIAWTAAPAIVLLIVFFVSLQALFPLASTPITRTGKTTGSGALGVNVGQTETLQVRIIAHQWWWEFVYPDLKITTANEMHVPVGAIVTADLEAIDVIHSFWVPQLAGKTDVIPGRVNQTWFQVAQPGTFRGQCAEFCGIQHANMRFEVVAESQEQFQAWVRQQQSAPTPKTGVAAKGEQIFMSSACIGCHTVDGTKAQGKTGPNLTRFGGRRYLAGAIMENTSENLARWLANPQGVKPGALMPNLNLSQDQINALVAYLESLK